MDFAEILGFIAGVIVATILISLIKMALGLI